MLFCLCLPDFEFVRHEHLYQRLNANIIRSDEFRIAEKQLNGCPVVLCTLSMLSNPRVQGFMHVVSINTLVVDEASQIAIQDYVPPLSIYSTIQKMCFIGDNKQCKLSHLKERLKVQLFEFSASLWSR